MKQAKQIIGYWCDKIQRGEALVTGFVSFRNTITEFKIVNQFKNVRWKILDNI